MGAIVILERRRHRDCHSERSESSSAVKNLSSEIRERYFASLSMANPRPVISKGAESLRLRSGQASRRSEKSPIPGFGIPLSASLRSE